MKKLAIIGLTLCTLASFAQDNNDSLTNNGSKFKYRVSFPAIILANIGEGGERTNTQHIELHVKQEFTIACSSSDHPKPCAQIWLRIALPKLCKKTKHADADVQLPYI